MAIPVGLAQALDNLIVNAIEHGGPMVDVGARRHGRRLGSRSPTPAASPAALAARSARRRLIARLTGRGRRGHGLSVVRQVGGRVTAGSFDLRRSEQGRSRPLEMPGWRARERMSRRGRALVFLVLAIAAAGAAAAIAEGYGSSVARGYGPLRPVVVLALGAAGRDAAGFRAAPGTL